jgi:hypothetical protein
MRISKAMLTMKTFLLEGFRFSRDGDNKISIHDKSMHRKLSTCMCSFNSGLVYLSILLLEN